MKRIHKLEPNISNKIAAGEVVERPAAVVKELVENAIDSGATKITVEIKKAGKALIRVSDNGSGIEPDDVELAFERHATSKIETVEDIYSVATLGFRGEALASISAVSNMDVITRRAENETGVKLSISGGKQILKEETGCPVGTTMVVKDLFFNTPARLKFLKSDNAERTALSDIVNKLALSHAEIGFRFVSDDKILFSTPGKGDLYKSIYAIYEKDMSRSLIPVEKSSDGITVKGFMTNLNYTRGNRSLQNFFVNGRYVKSDMLMDGVSMAYRTMLQPGRFPACFLKIEIDPNKVDVNIHPAKTEIKFHQEGAIKQFLYSAVRETLLSFDQTPVVALKDTQVFKRPLEAPEKPASNLTESKSDTSAFNTQKKVESKPQIPSDTIDKTPKTKDSDLYRVTKKTIGTAPSKKDAGIRAHPVYENNRDESKTYSYDTFIDKSSHVKDLPEKVAESISASKSETVNVVDPPPPSIFEQPRPQMEAPVLDLFKRSDASHDPEQFLERIQSEQMSVQSTIYDDLTYIGQMFLTYLIFEKEGKMYLIDQHAAHEKILFERLLRQYRKSALDRQILLDPILVELSYNLHASALAQKGTFEKLGLVIDDFGSGAIVIREIPALLDRMGAESLFSNALDKMETHSESSVQTTDARLEKIMQESCKTAIKAHDYMADIEVDQLLDQLKKLDDPYTCPHGRPIIISITRQEIEKKFKRT